MSLEETYRIERKKWDAVARSKQSHAANILPYAHFDEYARASTTMMGTADFLGDLRGKRVLEYGCGMGNMTAMLAKSGAVISTFDLSEASLDVARRRLELHGLEAELTVAAGEDLPYPDNSFDVVVGRAILHHLDVGLGARELHRVLRANGRAAFTEPMGMNPILNLVRDHVPYPSKAPRGADHPLTYHDIHAWGEPFAEFSFREIQLLSMLERAFGFGVKIEPLRRADNMLLRRLPSLRRYCRYVVMWMRK